MVNRQLETYAAGLKHADGLGGAQDIPAEQFGTADRQEPRVWNSRRVDSQDHCVLKYDTRISAPLESGGALTVCHTFKEFAPLLTEAKNLRDLSEDLLIHLSMGWETEEIERQVKAAIERTRK